ncbi:MULTISPECIES: DUF3566 domain-containing protein [Corynebacterium]|uniref:Membrane protein n=1 Tax=Corynebacterium flavescens TaxID=28028 RepID=A0A1L7CIS9_CORFL|nr:MULTISPECIES: DUF3566 domain-containing protein [Corynebacterium]APT85764.1 membrane protein [Corynebacterium flavescens]KAA8719590.1 DUF3566 domain-containing protein [Corynebacterium flavescens]MDN6099933.1 DUF3566 domain-containing protein [Corynebacterium flavescens]MDN6236697.1 DUF3566 domain-containing protein [Corynebacterium flavescens]MDN6431802.1 DUF3566 domain-containing protein [Corynebacterium flavescens]
MAQREVTLARISPFSAFRVGLALSLVGLVAWLLAVCLLYFGLDQVGIWEDLNSLVGGVGGGFEVTFGVVLSLSALVGAITAVLMTLLAPLMAFIYNAIVDVFGGLSLRLDENKLGANKQEEPAE